MCRCQDARVWICAAVKMCRCEDLHIRICADVSCDDVRVFASRLRTALVVVQFLSKQCSCCHTSHVASKSEPFIFTVDSSVFSCFLRGKSLYVYVAFQHFLLKLACVSDFYATLSGR